ncbi:MAG: methylenetetrahydrofolate reductase [Gammaproteobacteria bacterium]
MNRPDFKHKILSDMLEAAYVEVMPIRGVEKQLEFLPAGVGVTITCSPSKGIDATLRLAKRLSRQDFQVIPHLAARQVADTGHLKDILERLTEYGINALFVPGGDIKPPVGKFDSALQLLQAMSHIEHGIDEIGIAAYPEGHPVLDDQTVMATLQAKQEFATYFVTQMCFSAETITSWLARIREQGIRLPGWIGLPGAVERKKLFAYSLRVGVGDSARFAKQQSKLVRKLMRANTYQPDDLVLHLGPHLGHARYNIAGMHLFSFNQVEATQSWRAEFVNDLRQQRSG